MRRSALNGFLAVAAVVCAACGSGSPTATALPRRAHHHHTAAVVKSAAKIDRLTSIARARWARESGGVSVHRKMNRVASDPVLLQALRSGNPAAIRQAAHHQQAGTHQHISHLRLFRGSHVLADFGVPFCVTPAQRSITNGHGRVLATLQVSIQDVIGFVRLMHRHYALQVVVRGRGRLATSWAAAARAKLPASGVVRIGGRRFDVRSFQEAAMAPQEPVTVWILARA